MKRVLAVCFCMMMILSLAACGGTSAPSQSAPASSQASSEPEPASAPETMVDKIKAAGQLVAGVEATFPPFESYDANDGTKIIGFDIDLMKEVAKDLGVELVIKDMEFSGIVPSVQTGKIDVAPGITPTDERKEIVDFSVEYCASKLGVVVREDDDSIQTVEDLKTKAISAQLGSLADKQLTAVLGTAPKQYNKHDEAILAVKNGMIDGHVLDGSVGKNYAVSLGGLKVIEIPEINEGVKGIACITAKGDTSLLDAVNATIARLQSSGEMDTLMDTWNILK